jgi:acyl CoA:acetate/3-ketoacid CoA transferase beta subunit
VNRIITDMGVFDVDLTDMTGLTLVEIAPGITVDNVRNARASMRIQVYIATE